MLRTELMPLETRLVAAVVAICVPRSANAPLTSPDLRPLTRPAESAPETFATAAASSEFLRGQEGFLFILLLRRLGELPLRRERERLLLEGVELFAQTDDPFAETE
jgi:hypothetical protein